MLAAALLVLGLIPLTARPLFDDGPQLAHVAGFTSAAQLFGADCFGFWRPVKNLLFSFATTAGLPAAHVVALLVYAAAVFLLYRSSRSLGLAPGWSLAAAAVWALAPTQVSALAWLSGANIVAMTALGLFALRSWNEADSSRRVAALAAYAGALLCYEGAVAIPALAVLTTCYRPSPRPAFSKTVVQLVPWIAVTLAYFVVRKIGGGSLHTSNESFAPDLAPLKLTAASASFVADHLGLWLWPFGRQGVLGVFLWPGDSSGLLRLGLAWLGLAALVSGIWLLRRRRPLVSFGLAWFLVAFFPTSNFIPLRCGPFADYYLVFPSVGLALALVDALRWLAEIVRDRPGRATLVRTAIIALIVWRGATAVAAFDWARAWKDEQLLLERALAARPESFNVKASLASFHLRSQRTDEAARLANEAVRAAPWCSQPYFVLGQVALNERKIAEAEKIFTDATTRSPSEAYPFAALGYIADEIKHDPEAAKRLYREALQRRWSENSGTAALNLSVLLATEGQVAEARKLMETVLPRMPENPDLLRNLALACKQLGDLPAAENYHARLKRLQPAPRP